MCPAAPLVVRGRFSPAYRTRTKQAQPVLFRIGSIDVHKPRGPRQYFNEITAGEALFPLLVLWVLAVVFGALCVLASLVVRYRDISTLLPFWSQAGLFVTPVGYAAASAPGRVGDVIAFNPLTGLMEMARWSLLDIPPDHLSIVVSVVATPLIVGIGWWVFTRMEPTFADHV